MKNNLKIIFPVMVVAVFFIGASFLGQKYETNIKDFVAFGGVFAPVFYFLLSIVSVVFAPFSSFPLIPLAVVSFGLWTAFFATVLGWTIGSVIAFLIARKYGEPVVRKIISIESLEKIRNFFPEKNSFFETFFMRMFFPVDLLSYALGLFSKIDFKTYFLATLLGIMPFALFFSYVGTLNSTFQIGATVFGLLVFLTYVYVRRKKHENN